MFKLEKILPEISLIYGIALGRLGPATRYALYFACAF
jgi:hypothetical protein